MKRYILIVLFVVCFSLGFAQAEGQIENQSFFFDRKPYVNPAIVKDLSTWLSDGGDQVVAINLLESQESNRYSSEVLVSETKGENPYIYFEKDSEHFGYKLIGETDTGVYLIRTTDGGGGSGVFQSLMLVSLEEDRGISFDYDTGMISKDRKRLLIKKLGTVSLGDRWSGKLEIRGDEIFIGKDEGWFSFSGGIGGGQFSQDATDRAIKLDIDQK